MEKVIVAELVCVTVIVALSVSVDVIVAELV
jgi:hypothetical protein